MIAVLPQTGQRHRNANAEAAAGSQSQRVSVWLLVALSLWVRIWVEVSQDRTSVATLLRADEVIE
jgi:hypothetical protein